MKFRLIIMTALVLAFTTVTATELITIQQLHTAEELLVTPQFKLELSEEIEEAINSGIIITFVFQAKLMDEVSWWFDRSVSSKIQTFKLRYFSLSRQYELNNISNKNIQTFVTLDLLLNHLGTKTQFSFSPSSTADYIETRLFLDKQALPSTMQLPIVFDPDWNINSDWQKAELTASIATDKP